MPDEQWKNLPGGEIVLAGLSDIEAGRKSINASAVQCAAPRLRREGLNAPGAEGDVPAAHELYRQLSSELGDGARALQRDPLAGRQLRGGRRTCAARLTPSESGAWPASSAGLLRRGPACVSPAERQRCSKVGATRPWTSTSASPDLLGIDAVWAARAVLLPSQKEPSRSATLSSWHRSNSRA